MWWKIYFWIIILLEARGFFNILVKGEDLEAFIIFAVIIISLYSYIFKKYLFKAFYWKIIFWGSTLYVLINYTTLIYAIPFGINQSADVIKNKYHLDPVMLNSFATLYALFFGLFLIPSLIALFRLGYRSTNLTKKAK